MKKENRKQKISETFFSGRNSNYTDPYSLFPAVFILRFSLYIFHDCHFLFYDLRFLILLAVLRLEIRSLNVKTEEFKRCFYPCINSNKSRIFLYVSRINAHLATQYVRQVIYESDIFPDCLASYTRT